MPGPQTAMQRAREGTAAPGLEGGEGLESSLLQIASGSPWHGPACPSDSATECNCLWLKLTISSIGTFSLSKYQKVYPCSQKPLFLLVLSFSVSSHEIPFCTQKNPRVSFIFSSTASLEQTRFPVIFH